MPIVFVHGVAVRTQDTFPGIKEMLWQYVAPAMVAPKANPRAVNIYTPFWGNYGARFFYDRASLPGRRVSARAVRPTASHAERALMLAGEEKTVIRPSSPTERGGGFAESQRRERVFATSAEICDMLAAIATPEIGFSGSDGAFGAGSARKAIALDIATHETVRTETAVEVTNALLDEIGAQASMIYYRGRMAERTRNPITVVIDSAKQVIGAVEGGAGDVLSPLILKHRSRINGGLTNFFGDVFVYMYRRGGVNAPGQIVSTVLEAIKDAITEPAADSHEPLVILSHSMGGQIVYDILTYYMDSVPELSNITVDLWTAAASQVGLFEEMKLFHRSDENYSAANHNKVPFPPHVRRWYNVWDPDDILSYTSAPIFENPGNSQFEDAAFESHLSLFKAHGGYLVSPPFYREIAKRVSRSAARNQADSP